MLVLLPDGDIGPFEEGLAPRKIQEWRQQLAVEQVEVFLPKFKFGTSYSLGQTLAAMGMADAFSDNADFSGMTGNKDLYIEQVFHKAVIDVNEQGSEAAAVTAVIMSLKSVSIKPIFRADHPFLFMIIHQPTGSILFLGRVMNPIQ